PAGRGGRSREPHRPRALDLARRGDRGRRALDLAGHHGRDRRAPRALPARGRPDRRALVPAGRGGGRGRAPPARGRRDRAGGRRAQQPRRPGGRAPAPARARDLAPAWARPHGRRGAGRDVGAAGTLLGGAGHMTAADWVGIAIVIVLILVSAVFAAAETFITRVSKVRAYRLNE